MLSEAKHLCLLWALTKESESEILREACPERSRRAQNDIMNRW
jgi:hypothetical protein